MSRVMKKGALAWLIAIAFALMMVPSAFADDSGAGDAATQPTPGTLGVYVQVQTGTNDDGAVYSDAMLAKEFTADEIGALEAANTEPTAGMFSGKSGVSVLAAKSYVTLDQVLAESNVKFESGDKLQFTCTDGVYGKFQLTYEDCAAANKFFPAYAGGTDYDATGAVDAPAVFAFNYGLSSISENAAQAKTAALEGAKVSDFSRFCIGETAENYAEGLRAGNNFPSDIASVTVLKPADNAKLSVFAAEETGGNQHLLATLSAADVTAFSAKNTATLGSMYSGKGGISVIGSKGYVTLDQLLDAAGTEMIPGDKLQFTCTDGVYGKFQLAYEDCVAANKFFPAYVGGEDYDATGAIDSPAVFAFEYGTQAISSNAGAAKEEAVAKATASDFAKLSIGETAEEYAKGLRPGNNFPTGVIAVTILEAPAADLSAATVVFPKASVAYTGKAIAQDPTVSLNGVTLASGKSYTVKLANNTNAGKATATITGIGRYKGTATGTFTITPASNAVKVAKANVSKDFKVKNLKKKAATIALPKATATFGAVKWSVAKKDSKKVLNLKNGKVQVKKKAKKGTYTIKLAASVAKTGNYNAASANVTVKVKVK